MSIGNVKYDNLKLLLIQVKASTHNEIKVMHKEYGMRCKFS